MNSIPIVTTKAKNKNVRDNLVCFNDNLEFSSIQIIRIQEVT